MRNRLCRQLIALRRMLRRLLNAFEPGAHRLDRALNALLHHIYSFARLFDQMLLLGRRIRRRRYRQRHVLDQIARLVYVRFHLVDALRYLRRRRLHVPERLSHVFDHYVELRQYHAKLIVGLDCYVV